jgi:DNA replication protein DnaC
MGMSRQHLTALLAELVNALEQEKAKGKAGQVAEGLTKLDLVILDELGYPGRGTSSVDNQPPVAKTPG